MSPLTVGLPPSPVMSCHVTPRRRSTCPLPPAPTPGPTAGKIRSELSPLTLSHSFSLFPLTLTTLRQPLYHDAMPLIFNATVINGMGVTGSLAGPPVFKPLDEGGKHLHLSFEWSEELWPWSVYSHLNIPSHLVMSCASSRLPSSPAMSLLLIHVRSGYLALFIRVLPSGSRFAGVASGEVTFTVTSPPLPSSSPLQGQGKDKGKGVWLESEVKVQVRVSIVPTPERKKRVLWDNFHSIRYLSCHSLHLHDTLTHDPSSSHLSCHQVPPWLCAQRQPRYQIRCTRLAWG